MNDRQIDLIMTIVNEQLSDYLAEALVNDLCTAIRTGIFDNIELLDNLGAHGKEAV